MIWFGKSTWACKIIQPQLCRLGNLGFTFRLAVVQACWFWFIAVKQADGLRATWGWRLYAGVFSCGSAIGVWLCHSLVRSVLYSTKTAAGLLLLTDVPYINLLFLPPFANGLRRHVPDTVWLLEEHPKSVALTPMFVKVNYSHNYGVIFNIDLAGLINVKNLNEGKSILKIVQAPGRDRPTEIQVFINKWVADNFVFL